LASIVVIYVSDGATADEISVAYRRLAQMYQPDKVAGLAPEFQMLADQRMKEINVAYESLKHDHSDRVECMRLRPCTLPHHRTCGFPHPAVELSGSLPQDLMA
jgi:hypothetical protein